MFRFQQQRRRYSGKIILGPQPLTWTKKHRSFASREWFESQVRYGEWIKERGKLNKYLLYVTVLEGRKSLDILVKITHHPRGSLVFSSDHVCVDYAHVLRRKK